MSEEILNYEGYRFNHIKEKQTGFCGAGYYNNTLCGKSIIIATGCHGFGIVWRIKEETKKKKLCRKCKFLSRLTESKRRDYQFGHKKYPKLKRKKKRVGVPAEEK